MSPIKNSHLQTLQTQLHMAFQTNLLHCFEEVEKILVNNRAKDLQQALPQMLEMFFNFDGSCPDELNFGRLTSSRSYDFEVARHFFGIDSLLFSLVVQLSTDPSCYILYEFPFTHLPLATRNSITTGKVPAFYASKLKFNSSGAFVDSVLLDAFELYMFHLAYYVVNPYNWKVVHMIREQTLKTEWIYTHVVNHFLNAFFPPEPHATPLRICKLPYHSALPFHQSASLCGASPHASRIFDASVRFSPTNYQLYPYNNTLMSTFEQQQQQLNGSILPSNTLQQGFVAGTNASTLFQQQLQQPLNHSPQRFTNTFSLPTYVSPKHLSPPQTSPTPRISRLLKFQPQLVSHLNASITDASSTDAAANLRMQKDVTFTSDIVMQILVEFWLNQFDTSTLEQQFWSTNKMLKMEDYLLLVRLLIKQLHLFANSIMEGHPNRNAALGDMSAVGSRKSPVVGYISPSFSSSFVKNIAPIQQQHQLLQQPQQHSILNSEKLELNEFKRSIWSPWLCWKLYKFLKYHFMFGPLERPIIEIWLSLIQPWRYTTQQLLQQSFDSHQDLLQSKDAEKVMKDKWIPFVKRHVLFYTIFFELLVDRFLCLDLTSPNNSLILSRVAKVFSIRNLREALFEAEALIGSNDSDPYYGNTNYPGSNKYSSSPQKTFIAELEGEDFQYRPLFSLENKSQVVRLISVIINAKETLENQLISCQFDQHKKSWLQRLASLVRTDNESSLKLTMEKCVDQLTVSANQFMMFFQIPVTALPRLPVPTWRQTSSGLQRSVGGTSTSPGSSPERDSEARQLPDYEVREDGSLILTPLGRHEIITKKKKFDLDYRGDPDLQPIRSFECGPLVKFLFKLCENVNDKYSREIYLATQKPGISGWLACHLFQPSEIRSLAASASSMHTPPNQHSTHGYTTPRRRLNGSIPDHSGSFPAIPLNHLTFVPRSRAVDGQNKSMPRLSLRFLAKYSNFILITIVCFFIKYWFGTDFVSVFLLFGLFVLACVFILARIILSGAEDVWETPRQMTPVRQQK